MYGCCAAPCLNYLLACHSPCPCMRPEHASIREKGKKTDSWFDTTEGERQEKRREHPQQHPKASRQASQGEKLGLGGALRENSISRDQKYYIIYCLDTILIIILGYIHIYIPVLS